MFDHHPNTLAVDENGVDHSIVVVFHNFKGSNSMFVLQYLYQTHQEVKYQITVGTRTVTHIGPAQVHRFLVFSSLFSGQLSCTFGLTEFHEGFFPHLINTLDSQDYKGSMLPADMYDLEEKSPKKKSKFELWYPEQVANNYIFNLREEMEAYYMSDVKLLKASCQNFQ